MEAAAATGVAVTVEVMAVAARVVEAKGAETVVVMAAAAVVEEMAVETVAAMVAVVVAKVVEGRW